MVCFLATGMTHGIPCSVQWHRVVLDEAHTIKSHSAAITAAACALQVRLTSRCASTLKRLVQAISQENVMAPHFPNLCWCLQRRLESQ